MVSKQTSTAIVSCITGLGAAALLIVMMACSSGKSVTQYSPSSEFLWLIDTMDLKGYHSEMKDASKLPATVNFEQHELTGTREMDGMGENSRKVFRKAVTAWYYDYKLKTDKSMKPDGTIEEWVFKSKGDASAALEEFKKIYPMPYFNTSPHYIQKGDRVFIFSTRAMAFSYDQKPHYELLKNKLGDCAALSRL